MWLSGHRIKHFVADAGRVIDPYACDEIERALYTIISEPSVRDAMVQKGITRAEKFSWDTAARTMLDVYHAIEKERLQSCKK